MKQLLILAGVLALGFAAGWLLSPGPFRHWYKSSKEIVLVDMVDGKQGIIGRIPKGTLVVADRRLSPHGEIGWWGYVAVLLGTETEARQVLAVDVFQDQVMRPAVLAGVVRHGDVGMDQLRNDFDFAAEPLNALDRPEHPRREDLERHVALHPAMAGAEDLAHPARADEAFDHVIAQDRSRRDRGL